MGLAEVSTILWHERELLDVLLFKLEEEQLMLSSGRTRWLARATREVEVVLEEIRRTEVLRAAEVDAATKEMGLPSAASLTALIEVVDEPWRTIFREHRQAFLVATTEVTQMAESNRDLLSEGYRAASETLLSLTGGVETYSSRGSTVNSAARSRLVDEAL